MEDKSAFLFYRDWLEPLRLIDKESAMGVFLAIAAYALDGKEPESLGTVGDVIFSMIRPAIDRDSASWQQTKEARKIAGRNGGLAKSSKSSKAKQNLANVANASFATNDVANPSKSSKAKQTLANLAVNVNVDGNVNVNGDNPPKSPLTTPKTEKPAGEGESLSVEMATGAEQASPSKTLIRQRFDQFWAEYPRKAGKSDAAKVWKAIDPDENLFAEIMDGLKRAKQSAQWLDDGGKYIPNPANWLSKRRWEDQDPVPAESVRGGSRSYDIGAFEAMVEMGGIIPPMEGTAWEIE